MSTVTLSNNPPVAEVPIEDQHIHIGTEFSFQIPEGAFADPDGDSLTYYAWWLTYNRGIPIPQILPFWLDFDPNTGVFSLKEGFDGPSTTGTIEILVWAYDEDFAYAQQSFTLSFGPADDPAEPVDPQKFIASDGDPLDLFGSGTKINDSGIVVSGAYGDDDKGSAAGAVYVYTPTEDGYQETKLVASDGTNSDHFGFSNAVNSSGLVVVGAYLDDDNGTDSGSVYIFTPTEGGGYTETKLIASDGGDHDYFGSHVSVTDTGVVVVGAPGPSGHTAASGAVYVYTPDGQGGYTEVKLTASDETAGNYFGFATDINEHGVIFVGASSYGGGAAGVGTAYVYTPDGLGGYIETKLVSPDSQLNDYFGYSGAINADGTIVIGAMGYDAEGTDSGALYIYQPDGNGNYTIQKILPSDLGERNTLGRSVDINDDGVIVVGAEGDFARDDIEGAVYVYVPDGNGGYTEFKLTAYDGALNDIFGYSVSINNEGVITVGARDQNNENGGRAGSVYTFVPDEDGNYVGPDGTVFEGTGDAGIYSYFTSFDVSGESTAVKLLASGSETYDLFGSGTKINDSGIVVSGAYGDDDKGSAAGAVYVYTPTEDGYQETKLVASDGTNSDHFGFSNAVNSSGLVVVGAYLDDDNGTDSGSVYIFTPTEGGGYTETKLIASDGGDHDYFGSHVSVTDTGVVVVGAPGPSGHTAASGAVYVYTPDGQGGYTEVKLTASDETAGNYFGFATDINEHGVIFVGASSYGGGAAGVGTAYVYTPDGLGGYIETKLVSPDSQLNDYFGYSGAINADGTIVIGAMGYDAEGTDSGALYIYQPDGNGNYTIQKILPSDLGERNTLGRSVDINDDGVIVVGAEGDFARDDIEGAVYVYVPDGNGGYTEFKLTAYDGALNDIFGYSVSINNEGVITVGARDQNNENGGRAGSVYTFVPDEDGNYVGPDGTVFEGTGDAGIYSYFTSFDVSGESTAVKLLASGSETYDLFGSGTKINDSGIVVSGAYGDDDKGSAAGAVYVYTPTEDGYQETKLVASDGTNSDHFGFSNAVNSSGLVVVGAYLDDDNGTDSGSVYIFTPTEGGGYTETKLIASDGGDHDYFGSHVSVTDTGVVVVGAPGPSGHTAASGAVYVYTPDGQGGYTEVKLTASDETAGNYFGFATDINEHGVIFVGASSYGGGAAGVGTAYVYTPDGLGGYIETKLVSPDSQLNDYFGYSGAINADGTIVIGAMGYDAEGTDSGALYIYQPDGNGNYTIQKILPSDLGERNTLGRSVDINDDGVIVVGAEGDFARDDIEGAVYVYVPDGNGGYTEFKLTAYDGALNDIFGYSVSINNEGVITVGARDQNNENGGRAGSVYTFVPDEDGNYVGPDGTVYEPSTDTFSQKVFGTDAANELVGSAGADEIDGAGGDDTLTGGGGSDILSGGTGSDTFVFKFGDTGHDTIADFTAGAVSEDVMEFDSALFATYDALLTAVTDDGTNTTITIDSETTITLDGVTVADLHEDDFNFV